MRFARPHRKKVSLDLDWRICSVKGCRDLLHSFIDTFTTAYESFIIRTKIKFCGIIIKWCHEIRHPFFLPFRYIKQFYYYRQIKKVLFNVFCVSFSQGNKNALLIVKNHYRSCGNAIVFRFYRFRVRLQLQNWFYPT